MPRALQEFGVSGYAVDGFDCARVHSQQLVAHLISRFLWKNSSVSPHFLFAACLGREEASRLLQELECGVTALLSSGRVRLARPQLGAPQPGGSGARVSHTVALGTKFFFPALCIPSL